uniref:Uncharacterized protein n=1 Tax=Acrobeloides nanus TaxID=290746 RepID=A0A914D6P3_9BILA
MTAIQCNYRVKASLPVVNISESIEVTTPCPVKNQDVEIQSSCAAERIKKDKEMITEILDKLNVEATPVSVYHLPRNANSNDP